MTTRNVHEKQKEKKKLLFLTPELPYPPISGGKLKSWKLLEFLSQNYQVSVASILKEDDTDHVDEFLSKITIQQFYSDSVKSPRTLANLIKSYLKGIPLNLYRTLSESFAQQIAGDIHQYDLVISDHYEVFQYIPVDYKGKVILHEHNAYYLMFERYADDPNHGLVKRLISYYESLRVKDTEKQACQRADLVFASPNDIDTLVSIGIDQNKCHYTYHLGNDEQLGLPSLQFEHSQQSLLYVGSLSWEANVDGLLWFIDGIWPELIKKNPILKLNIVGKNPDKRLIEAIKPYQGIKLAGFVDDLEPYFQQHRVFIAPLRFGAGMKVKVLNAMCRGIPTVTTSVGSEGMDVINNIHLSIADDAQTMTDSINNLLVNQSDWELMEQNSRRIIKEKYTWKALFSSMLIRINQLTNELNDSDINRKTIHQ